MEIRKKLYIFRSIKYKKKIAISLKYHIPTLLNVLNFCNKGLENFALLLRECGFCYEYSDSWEKLKEKLLPPKEKFFSNLSIKEISDRN